MRKIRVKFCGGCNPHIDRGLVYRKIKELAGAEGVSFITDDGADANVFLVIDGCPTSCGFSEGVCPEPSEGNTGNPAVRAVVRISGQSVNMAEVQESDIATEAVKAIMSHFSEL